MRICLTRTHPSPPSLSAFLIAVVPTMTMDMGSLRVLASDVVLDRPNSPSFTSLRSLVHAVGSLAFLCVCVCVT